MTSQIRPTDGSAVDYKVREAVGVFTDGDELEDAIEDLQLAGFERYQIHLLASRRAAELKCKRMIGHVRELEDEPELPPGNYADRHELAEAKAALTSGLALLGSLAAVGAVVATGGAVAAAIAAAAAGGGVGGGLGGLLARLLGQRRAHQIEDQLRNGGLLLWVEVRDAGQEPKAVEILGRHSGQDVHVHELTRCWGADEVRFRRWQPDPFLFLPKEP
jgi:hypothetical protein